MYFRWKMVGTQYDLLGQVHYISNKCLGYNHVGVDKYHGVPVLFTPCIFHNVHLLRDNLPELR